MPTAPYALVVFFACSMLAVSAPNIPATRNRASRSHAGLVPAGLVPLSPVPFYATPAPHLTTPNTQHTHTLLTTSSASTARILDIGSEWTLLCFPVFDLSPPLPVPYPLPVLVPFPVSLHAALLRVCVNLLPMFVHCDCNAFAAARGVYWNRISQ